MFLPMLLAIAGVQDAPAPQGASVASPATDADGTQRWSILADPCAAAGGKTDAIVVCGSAAAASGPRLPLPGERGPPDRPMPSNPDLSGSGALAAAASPCATNSAGCTVGVDLFGGATGLVRLIGKLAGADSCCERPGEATDPGALISDVGSAVGRMFRKKPDKSKRVPIPLDDLPPAD